MGMIMRLAMSLAVVLSLTMVTQSASATVMKYADVARLVEISDVIVQGTVIEQKTYFDKSQEQVVTDTTLLVSQTFLGKEHKTITLQQWGGTLGEKTLFVPGDAHFEPKQEVIVFLHHGQGGIVALSALGQAKYEVKEDGHGQKSVNRHFADISFLVGDDSTKGGSAGSDGQLKPPAGRLIHLDAEVRGYDSFVAELRALVAGIKGGSHD